MSANARNILVWVLRALVAALFLFAGFAKLSGQPMMVDEFARVGFGDWFRLFTGALEVAGGVATLIPAVSLWGAALLLCADIGAFFAQAFVLHDDVIHTFVIGAVIAGLIYLQRGRLRT